MISWRRYYRPPTEMATILFNSIKNQVLHHLGAGVEISVPGQSMERHKEPNDKKHIRTLLVGLTRLETKHVSRSCLAKR